jgi:microcystin-dependent protein
MADFYMGQIVPFTGNFAPKNWMLCDGRLLPISQYTALFSILGTTYGGNGTTNFALPDLRGAVAISPGQAPGRSSYSPGQTGGSENVSLTGNQLPAHTHTLTAALTVYVNDGIADVSSPKNALLAQPQSTSIYAPDPDGTTMNSGMLSLNVTVGASGGSQSVPTLMPYLAVNYCICVAGIFPSRN